MRGASAKLLFTQQIPALPHQDTFLAPEWPPLLRPHASGRYQHNFENCFIWLQSEPPLNASCCFNCVGRLRNEQEVGQVGQVQPTIGGDHYGKRLTRRKPVFIRGDKMATPRRRSMTRTEDGPA